MKSLFAGSLVGLSCMSFSVIAHADVPVINDATVGAVYDGIRDGLRLPPAARADDADACGLISAVGLETELPTLSVAP